MERPSACRSVARIFKRSGEQKHRYACPQSINSVACFWYNAVLSDWTRIRIGTISKDDEELPAYMDHRDLQRLGLDQIRTRAVR